ncbi:hypothetical protein EDC01DRAFT_642371 [Geopyxis carbonaria]|nr:hypothetical protein EDC01DRAFT_642371 [Geopyxis carbonaria]
MASLPSRIEPKAQTLAGRLAVVTGATRGIGLAITLELASRGCSVVGTYLTNVTVSASLTALFAAATLPTPITFTGVCADIHDTTTSPAAIAAALPLNTSVDIVVNNASAASLGPLTTLTPDAMTASLAANVVFPAMLVRALLPVLNTEGRGRIINISSEGAHVARAGTSAYSAGKSALESLTRTWAKELGQAYKGLTVNAVAPGMVEGHLWEQLPEARREFWLERAKETAVAARIGKPEEVAGAVAWLAGDESRWISGSVVAVNGGAYCFN